MASGKYTGDGTASQFISLGFPPKAVLVERINGVRPDNNTSACSGGLFVPSGPLLHDDSPTPDTAAWISGNGFYVAGEGMTYLNAEGTVFYYTAFA